MKDSETIAGYLRSLGSGGIPSQREIDCLKRARMWEEAMRFFEEMESAGGGFEYLCRRGGGLPGLQGEDHALGLHREPVEPHVPAGMAL